VVHFDEGLFLTDMPPRTESTNFGEVPAIYHRTPLAAPVAAVIQKEPTAFFATALPYLRQIPGRD
jgi:hypothetical protein